jgi:hypothetical protein
MATPVAPNGPAVSYEPPQNEMSYYEGLFTSADIAKTGLLNGRDAVTFLSRSKLPVDLLKNIWNMADQNPKSNTLDKRKFFTAVRLIQLFQNGQKAQGAGLSVGDSNVVMRPPFFEGVTPGSPGPAGAGAGVAAPVAVAVAVQNGSSVADSPSARRDSQVSASASSQGYISSPLQHQQQHQQQQQHPPTPPAAAQQPNPNMNMNMALTQDPYIMLAGEQVRYESLFPQYEKDGFVYGKEAVDLFTKSGLNKEVLRDIWNLVDNPVDNRLSRLEFATAMHLIVCISKKNLPLPTTLPPSLQALKDNGGIAGAGAGGNPEQTQQQPQMGLPSPNGPGMNQQPQMGLPSPNGPGMNMNQQQQQQ